MTTRVYTGDCRDILPALEANSVHCCVTSPPYYGLRDYGTAKWEGGAAGCPHTFERQDDRLMLGSNGALGKNCTSWTHRDATPPRICHCGARRVDRQIGLEATPDEWLQAMVEVFREVRRVLRPDGTLWLNVGDSYANTGNTAQTDFSASCVGYGGKGRGHIGGQPAKQIPAGLKPKDLMMMPARLAIALQADGWWVRSDIIWHKPNPMPESCTDRPTSAHEHIFLLSKRGTYFYDADAVREESAEPRDSKSSHAGVRDYHDGRTDAFNQYRPPYRNARNVWTIATEAFSEAHFATYPTELVSRCIKAGTSERGCCAQCGAPWVREVERMASRGGWNAPAAGMINAQPNGLRGEAFYSAYEPPRTTGWRAQCTCNAHTVPCVVLDPFLGSGTTALVADQLQRDAIGIELNPAYAAMARNRVTRDCPLFAEVAD